MVERPSQKIVPEPIDEFQKIKIVVVGESGVGKTSFCKLAAGLKFDTNEERTIGSDFYQRVMPKS